VASGENVKDATMKKNTHKKHPGRRARLRGGIYNNGRSRRSIRSWLPWSIEK